MGTCSTKTDCITTEMPVAPCSSDGFGILCTYTMTPDGSTSRNSTALKFCAARDLAVAAAAAARINNLCECVCNGGGFWAAKRSSCQMVA